MLNDLRFRFNSLFRRAKAEAALDEELRFHLDNEIEKGLNAGLTRDQAEHRARLRFGALGQVQEECREARGVLVVETAMQDVRYGMRALLNAPVFTAIALLLLTLGIGVTTAVFSITSQVLLQEPAIKNPQELLQLEFDDTGNRVVGTEFSYPAFKVFSRTNAPYSGIFAVSEPIQVGVINKGTADLAQAVFESGNAPSVLGIHAARGRLSNAGDDKSSSDAPPVFLSYTYWQKRFGGRADAIGQVIKINTLPFIVAGVMPSNFRGITLGIAPDLILPVRTADVVRGIPTVENKNSWGFTVICRRNSNVTAQQIRASLSPAFAQVLREFVAGSSVPMAGTMKAFTSKLKFRVDSAAFGANSQTREQLRRPLTILLIITGLIFFAVCANLAGLILARTEARFAEIGVRLALGCSRGRLMRQLLTENALIAVAGGLFGVVAAFWTGPILLLFLGGKELAQAIDVRPDALTLAFGFGLAALGAILLGMAPVLRAARLDPQLSIGTSRATFGPQRSRLARLLIVTQIASSLVLGATAGQFVRSLQNYEHLDAGFRPDHLIAISVRPGLLKYNSAQMISYTRQVDERLSELPGIQSVTYSTSAFGQLNWNTIVKVPGYQLKGSLDDTVGRDIVGPRFVETMALTLISGRDFDLRDTKNSPAAVIVNESFARHFFGTTDVLGRPIFFIDSVNRPDTIIGVVRDARDRGLKTPPKPVAYSDYEHTPLGWITFTVRVAGSANTMQTEIVSAIKKFNPQIPISNVSTVEAQLSDSLQRERMLAVLSSILGALAMAIAMIGLYGLLAFSVTRRTREIAIRIALGARSAQVQWISVRDGLLLLVAGVTIGLPLYLGFAKLIQAQVFEVAPEDPVVLSSVIGLLLIVAGVAAYVPAWRAGRLNPVETLKWE